MIKVLHEFHSSSTITRNEKDLCASQESDDVSWAFLLSCCCTMTNFYGRVQTFKFRPPKSGALDADSDTWFGATKPLLRLFQVSTSSVLANIHRRKNGGLERTYVYLVPLFCISGLGYKWNSELSLKDELENIGFRWEKGQKLVWGYMLLLVLTHKYARSTNFLNSILPSPLCTTNCPPLKLFSCIKSDR